MKVLRIFSIALIALAVVARAGEEPASAEKAHTLFMAGDSTMAAQPLRPPTPARGWGQMLQPYFDDHVRVEDLASSGQSSKSFRDKGRWAQLVERLHPGDFVIIQFGHNDNKPDADRHTDPFGSFKENLERFVQEVRAKNATPILATSIVRNIFTPDGATLRDTHGDFVPATRKVAEEQHVPLLELNQKTGDLLVKMGPERAKRIFNNVDAGDFEKYPDGFQDGTHLNVLGASRVCDLAIEEIVAKVPELAKYVRPAAPVREKP